MPARDSFAKVAPVAAARVDEVEIILRVRPPIAPAVVNSYDGVYSFDQRSADGQTIVEVRQGSLIDKLNPQQLTAIKNFLDGILTKAQGTI
jgi:hypothetical protein